ncbi:MAG TPA: 5'-3' exonuclease H3TH domain-containing protein [Gemmatimonadales bacterium]|jgi:5'-3' exonuclease
MKVHLVDGTYELFRHYYAVPRERDAAGDEIAATRGVVTSMLAMLESGVTHIAVATDHVIESFRNAIWPEYKDGSGIEPDLLAQFHPLEDALRAMGICVWPMIDFEADDALGAGAALADADERVDRVLICTPDKDLAQCVAGTRVVQFDRRQRFVYDEHAIVEKFGVPPASIPDYLALVGDSADGYPGLPGWGKKSAARLLARYGHLEEIPTDAAAWDVEVRGAKRLAATLHEDFELALLFRTIATIDRNAPVCETVDELQWTGPTEEFATICERLEAPDVVTRAEAAAESRHA